MSAGTVAARRVRTSAGEAVGSAVARLRVVPEVTARASSGAFALFVAALLAFGLLGLLALNTLLTQGSFATTDLDRRQGQLADQEQALQREVAVLESPSSLATAARRIGMVATVNPAFIDPRTGRVLGVPEPGRAVAPPAPAPTAPATAAPTGTPTATAAAGATTTTAAQPKPPTATTTQHKPTATQPKPTAAPRPTPGTR